MQTPDKKKQMFLDMQEHPEKYSEEQIESMMDELDQMSDIETAWQRFERNQMSAAKQSSHRWLQIAASIIGVLMISGIVFAAWHLSVRNDKKTPSDNVQIEKTLLPVEAQNGIVRFDNVQLDSVLTVVANHYGRTLEFRNGSVRQFRFLIEWNREAPLDRFIELINNFEGIHVSEENDTIFAE